MKIRPIIYYLGAKIREANILYNEYSKTQYPCLGRQGQQASVSY